MNSPPSTDREQPRQIVLASSSPRRQRLLKALGLDFQVAVSDIKEALGANESVEEMVRRLSLAKAQAVADDHPDAIIIGADTVVVFHGEVLGKPADEKEAVEMLTRLGGHRHHVYSGLALLDVRRERVWHEVVTTAVYMRNYTENEIRSYVASGDPLDKAGAYAIQHAAFDPVDHIQGCYTNVVGLPVCRLYLALRKWGVRPPVTPPSVCLSEHPTCAWPRDEM